MARQRSLPSDRRKSFWRRTRSSASSRIAQAIIDAVMSCPTASLFIEFDDGKVISSADYDQSRGLEQMEEY
jgi:hypothetical protein